MQNGVQRNMRDVYRKLDELYCSFLDARESTYRASARGFENRQAAEIARFAALFNSFNSIYLVDWITTLKNMAVTQWANSVSPKTGTKGQDSLNPPITGVHHSGSMGPTRKGNGLRNPSTTGESHGASMQTGQENPSSPGTEPYIFDHERMQAFALACLGLTHREAHSELRANLVMYLRRWARIDLYQACQLLAGSEVQVSRSGNGHHMKRFVEAFGELAAQDPKRPESETLADLLTFIYLERNNIFPESGEPTFSKREGQNRPVRLSIYSAIMSAAQDLFFRIMIERTDWTRPSRHTGSVRGHVQHFNPISGLQTLAAEYGVKAPEGVLFYPCCGEDTSDPIRLFIDTVSEYHFVDIAMIPPVRNLPSTGSWNRPADARHGYGQQRGSQPAGLLGRFITSWCVDESSDGVVHSLNMLGETERHVAIHCHMADGEEVFSRLPSLSVFFYRGDSPGDGGSGVGWLGDRLVDQILDKLADGGLIVTDGSRASDLCHGIWPIWSHSQRDYGLAHYSRAELRPPRIEFEYRGRVFKLIGDCGYRYGTVYAWQVVRKG